MHWSRASVNPLLALRNAVCNDRWAEAWQQSAAHIRRAGLCRREVQPKSAAAVAGGQAVPPASTVVQVSMTTDPIEPRKPPDEHPWRRRNNATKAAIAQAKR